jgi:hypothetical protein
MPIQPSAIEEAENTDPRLRQLLNEVCMSSLRDSLMAVVAQGDNSIDGENASIDADLVIAWSYVLQSYATALREDVVQFGSIFDPAPATLTLEESEEVIDFKDIRWKEDTESVFQDWRDGNGPLIGHYGPFTNEDAEVRLTIMTDI